MRHTDSIQLGAVLVIGVLILEQSNHDEEGHECPDCRQIPILSEREKRYERPESWNFHVRFQSRCTA
jgi:hypothetical protein